MDIIEAAVCDESDINDNEMKEFTVSENTKVLLVNQKGMINAFNTNCPHFGGPLNMGVLGEGHIRCPWHGACFNFNSGDIEDGPGMDSLNCLLVKLDEGKVMVRGKKTDLENHRRVKEMGLRDDKNRKTFVVIGGGAAAATCVETLRQENFAGRIIMICKEKTQPYDRVKLSKTFDNELKALQYRELEFYKKYSIELRLGVEATKVKTSDRCVTCSNGEEIKYEKLFIATGSHAIMPRIPGTDLKNILTIRNFEDSQEIKALISKDLDVICMGTSFINIEAAAALVKKVKSVTLVGRDKIPCHYIFGQEVGKRILKLLKDNNIKTYMNNAIKECYGREGVITEVLLNDGTSLPCGLCIMGTGSRYNTDFLKGSGIEMNDIGAINADKCLLTNIPNVYVGGDIAFAPTSGKQAERVSLPFYQLAQYHGRIAGTNMARTQSPTCIVPFYWSLLFSKGFRYAGYDQNPEEVKIIGNLEELKFAAFLMDKMGKVIGCVSCDYDPVTSYFMEYNLTETLDKSDLEGEDPLAWTSKILPTRRMDMT